MGGVVGVAKNAIPGERVTRSSSTSSLLEKKTKKSGLEEVDEAKPNYEPQSALELRVIQVLKDKNKQRMQAGRGHKSCLNRVLLNFPKMQSTFTELHRLYDETDTDRSGELEFDEVEILMQKLNPKISKELVKEIFSDADVSMDGSIQFKELVCCIGLAYILDLVPDLSDDDGEDENARKGSEIFRDTAGVRRVFELATEMFLAFDVSCSGVISFEDMTTAFSAATGESEMTKATRASNRRKSVRRNSLDNSQVIQPVVRRTSIRSLLGGETKKQILNVKELQERTLSGKNVAVHSWKASRQKLEIESDANTEEGKRRSSQVQSHENLPPGTVGDDSPAAATVVKFDEEVEQREIGKKEGEEEEMQQSMKPKRPLDALSEERWKELDLDASGEITYMEFLVTFVKWVSSLTGDDEEEEEEENEKLKEQEKQEK